MLGILLNSAKNIGITDELSLEKLAQRIDNLFYREEEINDSIDREKGKKENWNKIDIQKVTPRKAKSEVKIFQSIYESTFTAATGPNIIFGDKYPKYYNLDLLRLERTLPNLKYIHISRHPYDVVNSMLRRSHNAKLGKDSWTKSQTAEMALNDWIEAWNFSIQKHSESAENFFHIKYEDLVFNQTTTVEKIRDFLDFDLKEINRNIISTEHHYERDFLTSQITGMIDKKLDHIPIEWGKPIEKLTQKYGEFKKIEKKRKFIKLFSRRKMQT